MCENMRAKKRNLFLKSFHDIQIY